jgi:hypothetical protein
LTSQSFVNELSGCRSSPVWDRVTKGQTRVLHRISNTLLKLSFREKEPCTECTRDYANEKRNRPHLIEQRQVNKEADRGSRLTIMGQEESNKHHNESGNTEGHSRATIAGVATSEGSHTGATIAGVATEPIEVRSTTRSNKSITLQQSTELLLKWQHSASITGVPHEC